MTSPSTGNTRKQTLPKSEILRGYRAFGRVLSRGAYIQHDCIRCYYDLQRKIPPYQCTVGFAVRKPGSAVRRNRLRRLLREAYRRQKEHIESLCKEQEFHLRCVFLIDGKRAARPCSYPAVREAVGTILETLQRTLKEA